MIAVSNTTPLRYLIAIGQDHLLGELFERVFVPAAVHAELTDSKTPEIVRQRIHSVPTWLEARAVQPTPSASFPVALHQGEREAILLAESLSADVLLMDEQTGRMIAMARNLPLSGTLGVLERADTLGLLDDFPVVLKQLKSGGFFIAESLERQLLRRHRERLGLG
jgi:predicted nucleic acid-binding protein